MCMEILHLPRRRRPRISGRSVPSEDSCRRRALGPERRGEGGVPDRQSRIGVDLIGSSAEGLSFNAFWRLLTDPEQSATLELATERVLSREFMQQLALSERRFLISLTRVLLAEGGGVHDVLRQFAASLKHFVQSREYLQQRLISRALNKAQRAESASLREPKH